MRDILQTSLAQWAELLPRLDGLAEPLSRLGEAMMACWSNRGKVLVAGNGGSAADAMHFAEELVVRFARNRRALPAIALADPTVISCAANDFGFESVFTRQLEALGNPGDVFVAMTTSGNSANLVAALRTAKQTGLVTAAFLGKDGGQARGLADIELLVPSNVTARIQEAHKLLFHTLCQWVDSQVD
jgi:D-sedoheptulose 7-phosphate isomerase